MEYIDKTTWERREAFQMFSRMEYPFYSVTLPVDVTNVRRTAKEHGVSFYLLMVWLCTRAVNAVPQFRLRVRGEQVVRLDRLDPSFTDMRKGEEQFHIVTLPWEADRFAFCRHARAKSDQQTHFIEAEKETDALIYFSCTPWFDFTALTNEHALDRDDCIPRLAWGKYYEENERLFVHLSVEVNHRTIDGFHIGQLKNAIDREIAAVGEERGA